MIGLKARIDGEHPPEAGEEQPCPDQQDECEGDLHHHQASPQPRRAGSDGRRALFVVEPHGRRRGNGGKGRQHAEKDADDRAGGERERDGGGIERNVRAARQILKIERTERAQPDSSDDEAGCRRSAGEDKAFGDELPCNSRPSCAERQSRRQFLAARP